MGAGVTASLTGRVRRWFAGLGFAQMWRLAVVLVLAATAAFGGLDNVNTAVTVFEPGEEFNDGQYTLTVERASVVERIGACCRTIWTPNTWVWWSRFAMTATLPATCCAPSI